MKTQYYVQYHILPQNHLKLHFKRDDAILFQPGDLLAAPQRANYLNILKPHLMDLISFTLRSWWRNCLLPNSDGHGADNVTMSSLRQSHMPSLFGPVVRTARQRVTEQQWSDTMPQTFQILEYAWAMSRTALTHDWWCRESSHPAITFLSTSSAILSSAYPISRSTSLLCSPRSGGLFLIVDGVSLNLTADPIEVRFSHLGSTYLKTYLKLISYHSWCFPIQSRVPCFLHASVDD